MKSIVVKILGFLSITLFTGIFLATIYYGWIGPSNSFDSYDAFPNISFDEPTGIYQPNDVNEYFFVTEKGGRIQIFENSPQVSEVHTLLDISDRVFVASEDGLLGFAFHSNFSQNGKIYTYHSELHSTRYGISCEEFCVSSLLSEYQVSLEFPFNLIPNSERILLELNQTTPYHRGGQLTFDDEGKLFVFLGDGQREEKVQDLTELHGKIIRIDVDVQDNGKEYGIPTNNPYYGNPNVTQEIYAYGLRNPWRGSIDPITQDIWVGDVGKDIYEEINLIEPTKNYGWPIYEGYGCKNDIPSCFLANTTFPLYAYHHPSGEIPLSTSSDTPVGVAIIGGYVYRGDILGDDLYGDYIFADYSGSIYQLSFNDQYEVVETQFLHKTRDLISQIGTDSNNELLFVGVYIGNILKLRENTLILFSFLFILNLGLWFLFIKRKFDIFFKDNHVNGSLIL